jgi:CubicO group peptidase (beta-lactamase class C family)
MSARPTSFSRVHTLMQRAIKRRHFPSACLLVARQGQPLIHQAYGRGSLDTVYDLASLTKPLATTAMMMQLCAEGTLTPSTTVTRWLPELDGPQTRGLRLWHLLAHASGLPAWLPFYQQALRVTPRQRRSTIRRLAARTPLEARPGTQAVYSDLGFILLDWILERCSGLRLDRLVTRHLLKPLGVTHTFFVDL